MRCRICESRLKLKYAVNNSRGENGDVYFCDECDAYFVKEIGFDYKNDNVVKHYLDHQIYIKNKYNSFFRMLRNLLILQDFWILGREWGIRLK